MQTRYASYPKWKRPGALVANRACTKRAAMLPSEVGQVNAAQPILASLMPNPSFKPTRYGRQRKPGLRHLVHHLSPGLRCLPTRAA